MRILWHSLVNFFNHDGPILAGSITCFFIMSIAPFFLFLVAIFGYFLGEHQEFFDFLATRAMDFFPKATYEIMGEIQKIIRYQRVGFFTLVLYAYFSYQLYYAFERAVNIIFESAGRRSLVKSLLLSLFVAISLIVMLLLFFGVRVMLSFMETLAHYLPWLEFSAITTLLMGFILPLAFWFFTTTALFMVLPQQKIRLRQALLGALVTTLLMEAGKHIFSFYAMLKVTQFGMIYGSLTAVVIFLLWVYYASCIFLIGAEIVHNLENTKKESEGNRRSLQPQLNV